MNKKQIFKALQNSVNDITPDIFEKISTANIVPLRTEDYIMKNNQVKSKTSKIVISFATIAAILTLFVGAEFYYKKNKIVTTISFDVNPSIEMTANKYDEVIDVYALNDDGTEILKDLDFSKTNVKQAVDEVVNSLVDNGFINEEKSSILMNVESSNEQKENQLSDNIASNIEQNLSEKNIEPTIFSQHGKSDSSTASLAKQNNISVNKMAFIKKIIKKNSEIKIEDLTSLNIEEIKDLMKEKKVNLNEVIEQKNQNKEENKVNQQNQGENSKNNNQIKEKNSNNANEKAQQNQNKVKERVSSNQSEKAKENNNRIKEKPSSNTNAKNQENKAKQAISNNGKYKTNSKK